MVLLRRTDHAARSSLPSPGLHLAHHPPLSSPTVPAALRPRSPAWVRWLAAARRRYRLCVLDYTTTCNHLRLLVRDQGRGEIAASMQLIAGPPAPAYNRRKGPTRPGRRQPPNARVYKAEWKSELCNCLREGCRMAAGVATRGKPRFTPPSAGSIFIKPASRVRQYPRFSAEPVRRSGEARPDPEAHESRRQTSLSLDTETQSRLWDDVKSRPSDAPLRLVDAIACS